MAFRISQNTESKASASLLFRSQLTAGNTRGLDAYSATPLEESDLPRLMPRLQQSARRFGTEVKQFTVTGDADGTAADRADSASAAEGTAADGKGDGDKEGGTIDVGGKLGFDLGAVHGEVHGDYHGPAPSCSLIGADRDGSGGDSPGGRADGEMGR